MTGTELYDKMFKKVELSSEIVELENIKKLSEWSGIITTNIKELKDILSKFDKIKTQSRTDLKASYKDLAEFGSRASDLGINPKDFPQQKELQGLRKELQALLDKMRFG